MAKNNTSQTPYEAFDGFLKSFKDGNTYIKRTEKQKLTKHFHLSPNQQEPLALAA